MSYNLQLGLEGIIILMSSSELWIKNIELLKSRVNRYGIYGLLISLATIALATAAVSFQMTGEISIESLLLAQDTNFALRILDFLPFLFVFWGQYTGAIMVAQASALVVEETDELRTETTAWKQKSLYNSTHDTLTKLPNRSLFYDEVRKAILVASRKDQIVVILYLDIDGFKDINDTFGSRTGDFLLQYFAERLQRLVQENDIIARISGDAFAILLTEIPSESIAENVAQRIIRSLKSPFVIEDSTIEVGASIGLALFPTDDDDAESLIHHAEIAMYAAKRSQKSYAHYTSELNQDNPRRIMLMSELRRAIDEYKLELHYQPKIDMQSQKITSVEALIRWNHPQYGRISPAEFVPLAERSRLIQPLTNWIIIKAISVLQGWNDKGISIGISINVSARDLNDSQLLTIFNECFERYEIEPHWVTLEITESTIMENPKNALETLNQLSAMNMNLSIDDFGTGYSSLAYLSTLPVDEIKIDQTFVFGMIDNNNDSLIVKSTIDLGHNLGLKVTAEGVENEQTWNELKRMGCDVAQGYYMSPPLSEPDLLSWLENTDWA